MLLNLEGGQRYKPQTESHRCAGGTPWGLTVEADSASEWELQRLHEGTWRREEELSDQKELGRVRPKWGPKFKGRPRGGGKAFGASRCGRG